MIKGFILALIGLANPLAVQGPDMNIAPAAVVEPVAEVKEEQPVEQPVIEEDPEEPQEEMAAQEDFYSEPQEELPTPADEFAYYDHSYIGAYTITWYAREEFGYDAPGASGLGCIPGYTCAVPESWMLGHTVLIEGYGYRLATDLSPDGVVDIYVASLSETPAYGVDFRDCYIVD